MVDIYELMNKIDDDKSLIESSDPKAYVKQFIKDFNIPTDCIRVKKGPVATGNYSVKEDNYMCMLDHIKAKLVDVNIDHSKYHILQSVPVATSTAGGRGTYWKTMLEIEHA